MSLFTCFLPLVVVFLDPSLSIAFSVDCLFLFPLPFGVSCCDVKVASSGLLPLLLS